MHSLLTGRGRSSLPAIVLALAIKGIKLSGFVAWITWLAVHRFYLVGFQDRLLVLVHWSIRFATRGRGARLIANPASAELPPRLAAHPEPGTTLLTPPGEGSHLSQMR
jgi:hypothetical protein